MKSNKGRVWVTAGAVILWVAINWLLNKVAPIIAGNIAGRQFENSDVSYVVSQTAHFFTGAGLPTILLLIALVVIWWKPLKLMWTTLVTAVVVLASLSFVNSAWAYYDKQDWPEIYFILPNESAFYIPDVGANKESQARFGTEEYLRENKIPAKRFQIPHVKLQGSAYLRDYYVPAGRLIIVDRTPYSREWVAAEKRGTSNRDEGIHCQSKEGLDITVGISIGASVLEDSSPRFLYRFGIVPPQGDRTQPEIIFTSVFHSRSLADVMDTVVRTKVQGLTCAQFTRRSFAEGNAQADVIMAEVEKQLKVYLDSYGIILDFLGWSDTFTFDPIVQKALNDRFAAELLTPVIPVLQAQADIKVKEGLGAGLEKQLPSTLLIPPDLLTGLVGMNLTKSSATTSSGATK